MYRKFSADECLNDISRDVFSWTFLLLYCLVFFLRMFSEDDDGVWVFLFFCFSWSCSFFSFFFLIYTFVLLKVFVLPTALHVAAFYGRSEIFSLLLSCGADVSATCTVMIWLFEAVVKEFGWNGKEILPKVRTGIRYRSNYAPDRFSTGRC